MNNLITDCHRDYVAVFIFPTRLPLQPVIRVSAVRAAIEIVVLRLLIFYVIPPD